MFRYPLICLLLGAEGCPDDAEPAVTVPEHPTVYVTGASRGVFEDGVHDGAVPCAESLGDQRTDYTSCCAPGFGPVGLTAGGDVVCVEVQ